MIRRSAETQEKQYPLNHSNDLKPLMDRIGSASHVLLGEASHGTHEYYTWRAAITKRLILEKGFQFIAVEGDWPDCYQLNRYVKGMASPDTTALTVLSTFERWPTWMWANWEVIGLIEWLKGHNQSLPFNKKVGFYGLDVYSLWESMEVVMKYLDEHDANAAEYARTALQCFEPYGENEQQYARAQYSMENSCQEPVLKLLTKIRRKGPIYNNDPEAALNIEQNAEIAVSAEQYYRNMVYPTANTWNIRDEHMTATYNRLLAYHGEASKAVIWEHNTHIGDARFTDMVKSGDVNVGQLLREQKGEEEVILVGFGSYSGTVIAGSSWGASMEIMPVPPARRGSIEEILHQESNEDRLLIFNKGDETERFKKMLPHRAIGVVYRPEREKYGNYVPSILNGRYDAFIYIDETKALHPLHIHPRADKVPDTFPFQF